jgi:hypothetical protein
MNLKAMLTVSAIYLGVVGLGVMLVPQRFGIGAVPADPSPELIAYLRVFGGPFAGIAVLNWLARKAEPSTTRDAIILANIVGFACVTAMDIWGVFGGDVRPVQKVFLVIHLLMTLGFILSARTNLRAGRPGRARA